MERSKFSVTIYRLRKYTADGPLKSRGPKKRGCRTGAVQNGPAKPAEFGRIQAGCFAICRHSRPNLHAIRKDVHIFPVKEYTSNFPLCRPFIPVVFASVDIILWNTFH